MLTRRGGDEHLPLELRLEVTKRLGNLRLEYLKRVYDGSVVGEQYQKFRRELHVHFSSVTKTCATYRAVGRSEAYGHERERVDGCHREFPVFVWIRDITQRLTPIASVVRLQPLDRCYMRAIESAEIGPFPSLESLWRVFDWELRSTLRIPSVVLGQLVDEIVEGRSQVVADFADQNAEHGRDDRDNAHDRVIWTPSETSFVQALKIEFVQQTILMSCPELVESSIQVSKMFTCPVYSRESAIKRVWCGHAVDSARSRG